MTALEEEILAIINCAICGCYISRLRVFIEDEEQGCNPCHKPADRWYYLALEMNQDMSPLVMGYQGTEEGFKAFIDKEFRSRQMERVRYWQGFMQLPHLECDERFDCALNTDIELII